MIMIRQETWKEDCILFCRLGLLLIALGLLIPHVSGISIKDMPETMKEGQQYNIIFTMEKDIEKVQVQIECQEEKKLIFDKPAVLIDEKTGEYMTSFTINKGFLEEDADNCSVMIVTKDASISPDSVKGIEIKRKRNLVEWIGDLFNGLLKFFKKENYI